MPEDKDRQHGVRPAAPRDLPRIVALAEDHAAYERAVLDPTGLAERLELALFDAPARALAWVAEIDGRLVGYASGALEFSTWEAREFLHLDCLYLDAAARGHGLGSALLSVICAEARSRGLGTVQWWTPAWNADAIRFYERQGARAVARSRFTLVVD